jgi:hypothetical protein
MNDSAALEKLLLEAFPQRVVGGTLATHDCDERNLLKQKLEGLTWCEVPAEFIRANDDVLPLLSPEAYVALLPAWLRLAVNEPDGPNVSLLLVNLQHADTCSGFTPQQASAIIQVAGYIAAKNTVGPTDPINSESLASIRLAWSQVAS